MTNNASGSRVRAGIVGASGYTGVELLRLLAGHPEVEVVTVTADSNAGAAVTELFPSLTGAYDGVAFASVEDAPLDGLDVVFLGLPHGESQKLVPSLLGTVGHVVDLAADFRLPADVYEQWYGEAHAAPELLDQFAFGMVELFRDDLAGAAHVAAPGCYPTAASLALAPFLAAGLIEPTGIVVNAVSGISGAGRKVVATNLAAERSENVVGYGLLDHRHTGEIEHALTHVAGEPVQLLFTPHLVPMTRGILATATAHPAADGLSTATLLDLARAFYADDPFVQVLDAPPATKATLGANSCHVTARYDDRTGTVLGMGAIDNLVKGASGQAIQAANLVLGLPETTGLPATGLWP
jgi:N-acetyl-gamma-glutamyl-phosphate reductase